ncbi:hypothetical protein DOY81_012900 [Sarcophaga bullata]|nr:hypothetical protein DOY81_012900 [Sarcophaga bullata]
MFYRVPAWPMMHEDNVYTCVGHPLRSDIERILETLLSCKSFEQAYDEIQRIKSVKGLALDDILQNCICLS